jgi:hypothetical protein
MCSLRFFFCTLLVALSVFNASVLAEDKSQNPAGYMPRLGDIMAAVQLRHSKLFYAARVKNWALADYELAQLSTSLKDVTLFYPDMPAADMTDMAKLELLVGESIKARNETKFDRGFAQKTTECNRCHELTGRSFINIRRSAYPSPFSNQLFAPRP